MTPENHQVQYVVPANVQIFRVLPNTIKTITTQTVLPLVHVSVLSTNIVWSLVFKKQFTDLIADE